MVTEAEARRLVDEPKVIGMNLAWKRSGQGFRLESKVLCLDSDEILSLRGFIGKTNRSFALLYPKHAYPQIYGPRISPRPEDQGSRSSATQAHLG